MENEGTNNCTMKRLDGFVLYFLHAQGLCKSPTLSLSRMISPMNHPQIEQNHCSRVIKEISFIECDLSKCIV